MNILSIGLDRELFVENSDVQSRQKDQAALVGEMHIVVFAKRSLGLKKIQFGNLYIYPTNSKNKLMYFFDAIRIGLRVLSDINKKFIITTQDPYETGIVAWCLSKKKKIPFQVQIHTDIFSSVFVRKPFSNRIRVCIAKCIIPKASNVRVVSKKIKDSIVQTCGSQLLGKIFVLPVFIRLEPFFLCGKEKELSKDKLIILVVSRFEKEKNVTLSLRVMRKVLQKCSEAKMIVVGDGALRGQLENMVKEFKIDERMEFVGWQEDLVPYYKRADVFLNTSNYEGYGRTLIEAAAASCAVVTTDVGIVGDVLTDGNGAYVCSPEDEKCLVQKLLMLCINREKRELCAQSARQEVLAKAVFEKEIYYKKLSESWHDLFTQKQ
ncbi:MAG: glycosyltransferase family 4 protein [Candidatus Pacebacteria bacterium]|nr:glycosyltransferase family 4 protein [Candidatus Paceibacterota bacterium]